MNGEILPACGKHLRYGEKWNVYPYRRSSEKYEYDVAEAMA